MLGQTISAGGIGDGEQVLDLLATHASTANFICNKLISLLVSDSPEEPLLSQCATSFLNSGSDSDQITQVLNTILSSSQFNDPAQFLDKFKTPLEFVVGSVRLLEASGNFDELPEVLEHQGYPLFQNHIPTGYGETGEIWLNSNLLLERFKFVNALARSPAGGASAGIDPLTFFQQQGYETAEGILWQLFYLTSGNRFTPQEWSAALDVLTDNGTTAFTLDAPDADDKLRRLIGTVLSYPSFQEQ